MFVIRIAGLSIGIENKYEYVKKQCHGYIHQGEPDFSVFASEEALDAEKKLYPQALDDGYVESVCIYREIALKLPLYDAFLMHAAVVAVDGYAYGFSAKSGTGKTTHTRMWHKLLGDRMTVINGDKPIFRFIDGKLFAFGTPWAGKEMMNTNTSAPLAGICFLHQSPDNSISRLSPQKALERIVCQILIPKDPLIAARTLDLISKLLTDVPFWSLGCNISVDAAKLCFETMSEYKEF